MCYLGYIIEGGTEAEVKARIGKAEDAFNTLNKLCRTKDISFRTKLKIFNRMSSLFCCMAVRHGRRPLKWVRQIQVFINKMSTQAPY